MHTYAGQPAPALLTVLSRTDIAECAVMALAALIVIGVVLPAVWSARPVRRAAAREVLELLLYLVRGNSR